MSSIDPSTDPRSLLGLSPTSNQLSCYMKNLAELKGLSDTLVPEIKAYPDAIYMNHYTLGLSLMFVARDGSKNIKKEDVDSDKLVLDSIDIYNASCQTRTHIPFGVSNARIIVVCYKYKVCVYGCGIKSNKHKQHREKRNFIRKRTPQARVRACR